MRLPSTKQLQYFVALADIGHFGRAADASHVSQSAFSNAIKELENTLQTQLVDRTKRQVTITATGQEVATQARLVLRDMEQLTDLAAENRQPLTGDLRLGVIPTIAPFLLPRVLPKLRRSYKKLNLYLIEDQTSRAVERLMDGELDVILLALPWDMRGVETLVLFDDEFCLACRKGTTRVDPEKYRFDRLAADSILLLEDGHCLRDHALAACRIRNTQKIQPFAASSILTRRWLRARHCCATRRCGSIHSERRTFARSASYGARAVTARRSSGCWAISSPPIVRVPSPDG